MNPDAMVALLNYREDGVTRKFSPYGQLEIVASHYISIAYITFWKHGTKEVKL